MSMIQKLMNNILGIKDFKYSPLQFIFFKIYLGLYLIIHFIYLIPYAPELFSREGMISDPSLLPTYFIFPNILFFFDTPFQTQMFIGFLIFFSLLFTFNLDKKLIPFVIWYGWACLLNRNLFISNPGIPFVGWMLLACILIPHYSFKNNNQNKPWKMPPLLYWGAWLIMSLGYTISGLHKLQSPSWINGSAFLHILQNPLARDTFIRDYLILAPHWVIQWISYLSLAFEVFFFPLALIKWTRPFIWFAALIMHFGIMILLNFSDLTLGILTIHFFTFNSNWIPSRQRNKSEPLVLFFDGVCGLCNYAVDFVMIEDIQENFKFSSLQSHYAKKTLTLQQTQDLKSLILIDQHLILEKSDAVIRICSYLGGIWRLFELLKIIPKPFRDYIYDWVAHNRYSWFGKKGFCRFPSLEEKTRFIEE